MTALPETALAFARECMGWQDCKPSKAIWKDSIMGYAPDDELSVGARIKTRFQYNNLDEVLDEVRRWCAHHTACLYLQWTPFKDGNDEYGCCISFPTSSEAGNGRDTNPCQALMAACLEAAGKLKAQTA